MADIVHELLATEAALDKFGARDISADEASQLPRNEHVTIRNRGRGSSEKRRLMVGTTDGGRTLTLVIERTTEPTTWLIITGGARRTPSVTFSGGRYERRSVDS